MDAAADRADLDAERGGDLLVRQALQVAEHHSRPEVRRERVERGLHVVVEVRLVVDLRRSAVPAGQSLGVIGQRVEADPRLAPDLVEEQVRRDPVQPALEGAGGVAGQRAEDADEDLLGEVLGVVLVAGQPVGEPVDARRVGAHHLVPRRRGPGLLGELHQGLRTSRGGLVRGQRQQPGSPHGAHLSVKRT